MPPLTARIGQDVHTVVGTPPVHLAAKVTRVSSGGGIEQGLELVDLVVFDVDGIRFAQDVPFERGGITPGTWHFPEYD